MKSALTDIQIVPAQEFVEGGGFKVHRPFPHLSHFDPILLVDEMGPIDYAPGEAIGAPDHPHRGFETVTYIIDGEMEHEDSHGHRGSIRSGDVQWMTAGAGVIHSEEPSRAMREHGGRMHGFQIWVNLPREKKMSQPRYQEFPSASLPIVDDGAVWVRVIAGNFAGKQSPVETTVPTTMLHLKLQPGRAIEIPVPAGSNAVVYAMDGSATIESTPLSKRNVALIANAPASLSLRAGDAAFEALVFAGMPLREPVARYGPFVMNTRSELIQAVEDYQSGNFGLIERGLRA